MTSGTSNRIYLVKGAALSSVLTHEMGHELNLLHTFECSFNPFGSPPVNLSCAENPNGSNSVTAGDKIADTPADRFTTD